MQYVIRRRNGGRNPYLVVRDEDGEIMNSFPSEEAADRAIGELSRERPYWESLSSSWDSFSGSQSLHESPEIFPRTPYGSGIRQFVEAAFQIGSGSAQSVRATLLRMESAYQKCSGPEAVRGWLRSEPQKVTPEVSGLRGIAESIGRYAAQQKVRESAPGGKLAYQCVQTLMAVLMDSLQRYPAVLSNAFDHSAVEDAFQSLSEVVWADRPRPSDLSEKPSQPLRGVLKAMLPEDLDARTQ